MLFNVYYITRKKLWMEVTGPGSKISSAEQLLALVLLSASLLIVKWIKAEISKKKEFISHNKHTIILSPRKDQGIKKAFFFLTLKENHGEMMLLKSPPLYRPPSSWNFVTSSFSIGLCPAGQVLLKKIAICTSIPCVCTNHHTGSVKALCPCYHLEWLTSVTRKGSDFFIWGWRGSAKDIWSEDSLVGRGVEQDPLKKKAGRLSPVQGHRHVGWGWRGRRNGEEMRLLSRRQSWILHLQLHTYMLCNVERWVSAIHMLLMALIPTSEVSGKISTNLGKTEGGPYSRAVVREMPWPGVQTSCWPC